MNILKPSCSYRFDIGRHIQEWTIGNEHKADWKGVRLDRYLMEYSGLPRNLVFKLIRRNQLWINHQPAKGNERLDNGDTIRIIGVVKLDVDVSKKRREICLQQKLLDPQKVRIL
jgi:23S rRNA-/tRNA-specific pseudouridylate synthase